MVLINDSASADEYIMDSMDSFNRTLTRLRVGLLMTTPVVPLTRSCLHTSTTALRKNWSSISGWASRIVPGCRVFEAWATRTPLGGGSAVVGFAAGEASCDSSGMSLCRRAMSMTARM